jgi:hypothetical protein
LTRASTSPAAAGDFRRDRAVVDSLRLMYLLGEHLLDRVAGPLPLRLAGVDAPGEDDLGLPRRPAGALLVAALALGDLSLAVDL